MKKKLSFLSFGLLLSALFFSTFISVSTTRASEPAAAEEKAAADDANSNPPPALEKKASPAQDGNATPKETTKTKKSLGEFWDKLFKTKNSNSNPSPEGH